MNAGRKNNANYFLFMDGRHVRRRNSAWLFSLYVWIYGRAAML